MPGRHGPTSGRARPLTERLAILDTRPAAIAVLVLAAACEAVWAHALGAGLTSVGAGLAFGAALFASFAGLAWAMRTIPMGTAYALWTGLGAALTAAWGFLGGEAFTPVRAAGIVAIVVGAAGLQLTAGPGTEDEPGPNARAERTR